MNDLLSRCLRQQPDLYPHKLDERFPRLVEKIASAWHSPELAAAVFEELLVDRRGGRQGFPPEIAREIYRLSVAHDQLRGLPQDGSDVWAHEREQAVTELAELGFRPVAGDMLRAAESGDADKLRVFLRAGMPVDTRDARDWTPLMVASFNGNESVAKLLIENGANPTACDRGGYTPLHWAALKGYAQVVAIIAARIDVDVQSTSGFTALLQAAAAGHVAAAQVLIGAGADVNLGTREGWTPLHKAVANGHTEVVRLLLKSGADIRALHDDGSTPLSIAAEKGRSPLILRLLRC
jgi:ankyrin repeat protein